jgi:FAD:protein FMN transferase
MRTADYALGTIVTFDVRCGGCPRPRASRALRRARAQLHQADELFSTWKPDSPMSRLRRDEITLAQAPPEVADLLWACAEARRVSNGRFDPWSAPGGVDPGSLVRGWSVARARDVLRRAGVQAAVVDAGGVVATWGRPEPDRPWRIPIGGSRERDGAGWEAVGVESMATAPFDRRVARAPGTARPTPPHQPDPPGDWRTCTVSGPDPVIAQALAAAVLAAGPDGMALVRQTPGYDALAVGTDGSLSRTAGFPGRPAGRARGAAAAA